MGSAGDLFPLGVLPQVNRRAARSRRGAPSRGDGRTAAPRTRTSERRRNPRRAARRSDRRAPGRPDGRPPAGPGERPRRRRTDPCPGERPRPNRLRAASRPSVGRPGRAERARRRRAVCRARRRRHRPASPGGAPAPRRRPTAAPARRPHRPAAPPPARAPHVRRRDLRPHAARAVLGRRAAGHRLRVGEPQTLLNNITTTDVISDEGGGEKPADGAVDILMVGMDSRTDAQGNPLPQENSTELHAGDERRRPEHRHAVLMHVPNDGGKAIAVSFPRDSYVEIAGGYGRHKINSAYGTAKDDAARSCRPTGVSDPSAAGGRSRARRARRTSSTPSQNLTGVTIDHYAEINLVGFYEITKAVGGVDVCLNQATRGQPCPARTSPPGRSDPGPRGAGVRPAAARAAARRPRPDRAPAGVHGGPGQADPVRRHAVGPRQAQRADRGADQVDRARQGLGRAAASPPR